MLSPCIQVSASPVSLPEIDRRAHPRHPCLLPTSCKPACANEMKWDAMIRNISQGGLRLVLRRRFERGTGLAIELPDKDRHESYVVFVKVVDTRPEEGGLWSLGCQFISQLSEDELHRLVALAASGGAPPKREKRALTGVRLQINLPEGGILRRRVKRLLVASNWPYPAGMPVRLRVRGKDGSRQPYDFVVVECHPRGAGWTLEVRLADPTAADALLRFVRG